jgi:hypothetical protein
MPVTLKRITLSAYQLLLLERAARTVPRLIERGHAAATWMRQTDEAHRELIAMADLLKTSFSGTIDYVSDEAIEEPSEDPLTISRDAMIDGLVPLDEEIRQHG